MLRIADALDRLEARLAALESNASNASSPPDWARSEEGLDLREIVVPNVPGSEVLRLDFEMEVNRIAADAREATHWATSKVLSALPDGDFSSLAEKNRAFDGYDWTAYLRLSEVRLALVLRELRARGVKSGRILDYGSYFGNFSLAAARSGYEVDAFDSYRDYGEAFAKHLAMLKQNGVTVLDAADLGYDLEGLNPDTYDAAFMMGVIEHIPSSPRSVLEGMKRVLKPGGLFVLDTPNLSYAYARRRFVAGQSTSPSIAAQYWSDTPFSGHHREFTANEIKWILADGLGMTDLRTDCFNYSIFGLSELSGLDLALWRMMQTNPTLREVIFASARKPF